MLRAAWKSILARKLRLALTAVAVVLGVGFTAGTYVRNVQGVRAADGDVAGYAQLIDPKTGKAIGNGGAPTFGNSWDPNTTTFTLRTGAAPSASDQIAVDAATADKYTLTVGESVKVITVSGTSPYTISGIVGFGSANNLGGATITIFSL